MKVGVGVCMFLSGHTEGLPNLSMENCTEEKNGTEEGMEEQWGRWLNIQHGDIPHSAS